MKKLFLVFIVFFSVGLSQQEYRLINSTYLGNEKRNYYGENAPDSLNIIWKTYLGEGITKVGQKERVWRGSGWTGQVLMLEENNQYFLIHGALSHYLRKIDASSGAIIWEHAFPDAIKGTGTLWTDKNGELMILQGCRRGPQNSTWSSNIYPFRAISYQSGEELWRYHVQRGASYSVDVDGTPLIIDDTLYLGLETGSLVVLDPDPAHATVYEGHRAPKTLERHALYHPDDKIKHGYNLITESSPSRIGDHVYISSGSGHVYGYNLKTREIDWDFFTGADMDGSATVSDDNCILITVEKQYIDGYGGVFKLDPSKKPDSSCVVWYYPTGDDSSKNATWGGGVIGTASVNDATKSASAPYLAAVSAIDGYMYLIKHDELDSTTTWGPNLKHRYPKPKLYAKRWIGQSISTPLFVGDHIVAASYSGVSLFKMNEDGHIVKLGRRYIGGVESTPFVYDKRIYIGSRDGYLYCLGE
jgi:outer membrane protein assembly factor BamB